MGPKINLKDSLLKEATLYLMNQFAQLVQTPRQRDR